jgi:hypothetical protein
MLPLLKVFPYGLKYYDELIGGPWDAWERGMETTYLWTAVNDQALTKINNTIPAGATLLCWPAPARIGEFYQELDLLRPDIKLSRTKEFDYLLVLSRPYVDFEPTFAYLKVKPDQLAVRGYASLDGVPLWVLYERKTQGLEKR